MAIVNCPECGAGVSDTAENCPKCGYILKAGKTRKKNRLRIGAIVNIIGGIGMLLMYAAIYAGSSSASSTESDGVTITVGPELSVSFALLYLLYMVALVVVTTMSFIVVARKNPTRKGMTILCGIQLIVAIAGIVGIFTTYGTMVICGSWVLMWGSELQLIGSFICFIGARQLAE